MRFDWLVEAVQVVVGVYLIVTSGGAAAGILAGTGMLASAASTHEAARRAKNAREKWRDSIEGIKRTVKGPTEARHMILGTERVGGVFLFADTNGTYGEWLHLVIAYAGHQVSNYQEIWFNDQKLDALVGNQVVTGPFSSQKVKISTQMLGTYTGSTGVTIPTTISLSHTVTSNVQYPLLTSTATGTSPATWIPKRVYAAQGFGGGENGSPVTEEATFSWNGSAYTCTSRRSLAANGGPATNLSTSGCYVSGGKVYVDFTGQAAYGGFNIEWEVQYNSSNVQIVNYYGTDAQAASAQLMAAFPTKWTSAHPLSGIAYLHIMLRYNQETFGQSGIPNISAVIAGALVPDFTGAAASYSNNAARCIAYWLQHPRLGLGVPAGDFVTSEWLAEQQLADENVQIKADGTTQKRYTIDTMISSDSTAADTKARLEEAVGGALFWAEGRWVLRGAKYRAPTITINEGDLAGTGIKVSPNPSRQALINRVQPTFINPDKKWGEDSTAEITNATYKTEDNNLDLLAEPTWAWCKDYWRAQRLGKLKLDKSRNARTTTLITKFTIYDVQLYDNVTLNLPTLGLTGVFEVLQRSLSLNSCTITYVLIPNASTLYDWTYTGLNVPVTVPAMNLPSASAAPANVTGVTLAAIAPTSALEAVNPLTRISWTVPADPFVAVGGYVVFGRNVTDTTNTEGSFMVLAREPASSGACTVSGLLPGYSVNLVYYTENARGRRSEPTLSVLQVPKDSILPVTPGLSFAVSDVTGGAVLTWTDPRLGMSDYKYSEVRIGTTGWATDTVLVTNFTDTRLEVNNLGSGTFTLRVKHFDWSGNASNESNLVAVIGAAPTETNLVMNSGFERLGFGTDQPAGYDIYTWNAGAFVRVAAAGYSGGSAYAIKAVAAVASGNPFGLLTSSLQSLGGVIGGVNQLGGWIPNAVYTVSFRAKKVNGANVTNMALNWNTSPTSTEYTVNPNLTTSWQRYSFKITMGASVEANGGLYLRAAHTGVAINDEVHFDDLKVERGSLATEWTPSPLDTVGVKRWRVVSKGFNTSYTYGPSGLYDADRPREIVSGIGASYTLYVFSRATGEKLSSTVYNVYGSASNATTLAAALNALGSDVVICLLTDDEPLANRLANGLPAAIYRCGGSPQRFESPNFYYRGAYALIGIPGSGMGAGSEHLAGSKYNPTDAWIDVQFTIDRGQLLLPDSQGSVTITDLQLLNQSSFMDAGGGWAMYGGSNYTLNYRTDLKGASRQMMRAVSSAGSASGWTAGYQTPRIRVSPNRTLRVIVPFKVDINPGAGGNGAIYFGIIPDATAAVCSTNTTTPDTNPYFAAAYIPALNASEWYYGLGYIYPAGTTSNSNTGAGVYRVNTGALVNLQNNLNWNTNTTDFAIRAGINNFATVSAETVLQLMPPIVHEMDGSEPSVRELLGEPAVFNQQLTLNTSSGQLALTNSSGTTAKVSQAATLLTAASSQVNSTAAVQHTHSVSLAVGTPPAVSSTVLLSLSVDLRVSGFSVGTTGITATVYVNKHGAELTVTTPTVAYLPVFSLGSTSARAVVPVALHYTANAADAAASSLDLGVFVVFQYYTSAGASSTTSSTTYLTSRGYALEVKA